MRIQFPEKQWRSWEVLRLSRRHGLWSPNQASCCSVAKSYPTLCVPMDCSTPGFSVLHCLLEFAPTHVHWVSDAIQPSHPQLSPPPALNLSQHQGLFLWVSSSHQVAKVLELQHQHQSLQWIFRIDFLDCFDLLTVQGTLKSLLQHHTVQSINSLALSLLYSAALTSSPHDWMDLCWQSNVSAF